MKNTKTRLIAIITFLACTIQPSFAGGSASLVKKAVLWAFGGAAAGTAAYMVFKPADVEDALKNKIQTSLDDIKQKTFDQIHPIGTAKSIKVHEVNAYWQTNPPKKIEDLEGFVVRYTIYWAGPIEKDGYTKVVSAFDAEVGRFVESKVLETNGIQHSDIGNGLLAILDACL